MERTIPIASSAATPTVPMTTFVAVLMSSGSTPAAHKGFSTRPAGP
jgi:hypothetical protein